MSAAVEGWGGLTRPTWWTPIGVVLAIAMLLSAWCGAKAADWAVDDMNRTINSTNFIVNRGCSGTLIDLKNRYVLTAEHCVSGLYETVEREKISDDGVIKTEKVRRVIPGQVQQLNFDNALQVRSVTYRAKLILADKDNDLALLQIMAPIPNTIAAELACTAPVRGDTAIVVGNPFGILYSSVTKGIVSATDRNYPMLGIDDQGDNALVQISSGIIGGNSGGAVYDAAGKLVGVPVRGSRVNEIIGFSVPLDKIKSFLRRKGLEDALWGDRCSPKPAAPATPETKEEPLIQLGSPNKSE